jgi:integrase
MLYRRGRFWWYRFKFGGAEIRESARTASKTVARRIERERRRQLEEGAGGVRRRRPKLFRTAAEEWLDVKRPSLSPSTVKIEKLNLEHLKPFFGGILTCDVEAADVARYQEKRQAEGASAGTVNLEVATLRAILRRTGLWAALQPDVRMLPEAEDVGRAISEDEERRLLHECAASRSRALYPAVVLALNTGLRFGELVGLRWKQADLAAGRLVVGKSKTKAGTGRIVPLNAQARAVLAMWADRFPNRLPEHYVFASEKYGQGGAVYASNPEKPIGDLKEAWEAAKRRTGDKEKAIPAVVCRWHDLRHTFCSRLVESGHSLPILAALMGWSPATTARMAKRYGHVSQDALRGVVASLDRPDFEAEGAQKVAQSAPHAESSLAN